MHLLASFIRQYFKEFFEWIQSYDVQFSCQNDPFSPNENVFRKTINASSMYLLGSLIVKNFKEILRVDPDV